MRIFFKILTLSVFNDYQLLALCKKVENSIELFLRKIVRRQRARQTDRHTDRRGWTIGLTAESGGPINTFFTIPQRYFWSFKCAWFSKFQFFHVDKNIPTHYLMVRIFSVVSKHVRHALPCKSQEKYSISIEMKSQLQFSENQKD